MVFAEHSEELILVWKHPVTRLRYVIGRLWRDWQGYHFRYDSAHRGIDEALEAGFRVLDAFPALVEEYEAPELFATFARRLPPRWRHQGLRDIGIDPDDPFDYFRRTGGRLATDTLEFLEPIRRTYDPLCLEYTVRFPVAGWHYYDGEAVIDLVKPGDPVRLELESDNRFDPSAVRTLLGTEQTLVGYVPAIYAWHIDESVVENRYTATVLRIGAPDDPQQRLWISVIGETVFGLSGDLSDELQKQEALLYR